MQYWRAMAKTANPKMTWNLVVGIQNWHCLS